MITVSNFSGQLLSETPNVSTNAAGNDSFQSYMKEQPSRKTSAPPNQEPPVPACTLSSPDVQWTAVSPGVMTSTTPDGHVVTSVDPNILLTPEDKALVGWPCSDNPQMMEVADFIASDRACGDLTGPVTMDYIFGNKSKGIAGMDDRFPDLTDDTIDMLAKNLVTWNYQHNL